MAQRTGYQARDERIAKTAYNAALRLLVRDHPAIPRHNNAMALAARRRVRTRDVRFGPQSRAGAQAWDTVQTIAATATTLGVGLYHYLRDRCLRPTTTPSLADRVRLHAQALPTEPSDFGEDINDWGQLITNWSSINIYERAIQEKSNKTLDTLRKEKMAEIATSAT